MFCPYCNEEIRDDSVFCGDCGKRIDSSSFSDTDFSQEENLSQEDTAHQKKKKGFPLWIGILGCGCLTLVVVVLIIIVLLFTTPLKVIIMDFLKGF
ncbi:MAG TPA: zinc-ribbon domain-containing protein [Candidatus Eremiobacteraeota bacterium]|nr:MAG: hypothetical protein BWY64_01195 [bacterium ADurb.Bin363]HPZ09488.1 zinc-ribbon domain-containing protein [Candidatus Eremiobacteraeota bacterium]